MRIPSDSSRRIQPGRRLYILLERFELTKGKTKNATRPSAYLKPTDTVKLTEITEKDLRKRYFQLAKERHPDFAPDAFKESAERNFIAL